MTQIKCVYKRMYVFLFLLYRKISMKIWRQSSDLDVGAKTPGFYHLGICANFFQRNWRRFLSAELAPIPTSGAGAGSNIKSKRGFQRRKQVRDFLYINYQHQVLLLMPLKIIFILPQISLGSHRRFYLFAHVCIEFTRYRVQQF